MTDDFQNTEPYPWETFKCCTIDCTGTAEMNGGWCPKCKDEHNVVAQAERQHRSWDVDGKWMMEQVKSWGKDKQ